MHLVYLFCVIALLVLPAPVEGGGCDISRKSTKFYDWGNIHSCSNLREGRWSVKVVLDANDNDVALYLVKNNCKNEPWNNPNKIKKWDGHVDDYVSFTVDQTDDEYCFAIDNNNWISSARTYLSLTWYPPTSPPTRFPTRSPTSAPVAMPKGPCYIVNIEWQRNQERQLAGGPKTLKKSTVDNTGSTSRLERTVNLEKEEVRTNKIQTETSWEQVSVHQMTEYSSLDLKASLTAGPDWLSSSLSTESHASTNDFTSNTDRDKGARGSSSTKQVTFKVSDSLKTFVNPGQSLECSLMSFEGEMEVPFTATLQGECRQNTVKGVWSGVSFSEVSVTCKDRLTGVTAKGGYVSAAAQLQPRVLYTAPGEEQGGGVSAGLIAGIVIGVFALIALVVGLGLIYTRLKPQSTPGANLQAVPSAHAVPMAEVPKTDGSTSAHMEASTLHQYVHEAAAETKVVAPSGSTPAAAVPAAPTGPPAGWSAVWSEEHSRDYYFHAESQKSVWDLNECV